MLSPMCSSIRDLLSTAATLNSTVDEKVLLVQVREREGGRIRTVVERTRLDRRALRPPAYLRPPACSGNIGDLLHSGRGS